MSTSFFISGLVAAVRGFSAALGNRGVRRVYWQLVAVLVAVTVVLQVAGVWLVLEITERADSLDWYWALTLVLLRVAGILIVLFASPLVALLLVNGLAPLLAERVFLASLRAVDPVRATALEALTPLPFWTSAGCNARRLLRYVAMSAVVLLVSFVPFVGPVVAPVVQLIITARALGWEILDPYLSLSGFGYRQQREYLLRHGPGVLGFAVPFTVPLAVPFVGPFLFGIAHAASAVLVADVLEPGPA